MCQLVCDIQSWGRVGIVVHFQNCFPAHARGLIGEPRRRNRTFIRPLLCAPHCVFGGAVAPEIGNQEGPLAKAAMA